MKQMRNVSRLGATVVLMALPAALSAQVEERPRGEAPMPRGPGVERVLDLRDRLDLTQDQVDRLDQVRREAVQWRLALHAEREELRSRVRAGQADRSEMRALMRERRDAVRAERERQQERVESVLNEAQRQQLQQMTREARAFQRGRLSAMRDRMRGGGGDAFRGARQGMRGPWGRGFRNEPGPGMRGGRGIRGQRGPGFRGGRGPGAGAEDQR